MLNTSQGAIRRQHHAPQDGYTHDAQCIVYRGPDKKYFGRDICYGYNEDTLSKFEIPNTAMTESTC